MEVNKDIKDDKGLDKCVNNDKDIKDAKHIHKKAVKLFISGKVEEALYTLDV